MRGIIERKDHEKEKGAIKADRECEDENIWSAREALRPVIGRESQPRWNEVNFN